MNITPPPWTRKYVYKTTANEIIDWAIKQKYLRSPNGKSNFPFMLQKYINFLKTQNTNSGGKGKW